MQVAIKRVSHVFDDLEDTKRILREIELLRHLGHHDNIMELLDIIPEPPNTEDFHTLYIVTQMFESDLGERIAYGPQLTVPQVRTLVFQLLRGLKFLHASKVAHGGLMLSSILVNG